MDQHSSREFSGQQVPHLTLHSPPASASTTTITTTSASATTLTTTTPPPPPLPPPPPAPPVPNAHSIDLRHLRHAALVSALANTETTNQTVQTVSSMTTSATLPHPTIVSDWALSVYRLTSDIVHIEHPNGLGVTQNTGLAAEALRFRRFRCVYISRQMHQIAMHDIHGPNAFVFRRIAASDFLTLCRRKRCFRREFLPPRPSAISPAGLATPPQFSMPQRASSASVPPAVSFIRRSNAAVRDAADLYGEALMADIHLGFTRLISVTEPLHQLPSLEQMIANPAAAPILSQPPSSLSSHLDADVLSLVVSYRHVTPASGRLLNILPSQWPHVLATIHALCRHVGVTFFRLWTDQMLAVRAPSGTMRWTSAALLPYTLYPVLYVVPDENAPSPAADLSRMWIAIEHLAASFGHGLIHSGNVLSDRRLPKEWPTAYVSIVRTLDSAAPIRKRPSIRRDLFAGSTATDNDDTDLEYRDRKHVVATWVMSSRLDMPQVVRKLVGVLMSGFVRNKSVRFAHDGQAIVEWASVIASSVTYGDIGHTYTCDDCRKSLGFAADVRILTLLGSALTIVPMSGSVCTDNQTHPKINVPAVRLTINSRSWDGVREWLPECCLWGAEEDERNDTWRSVLSHTKAIVVSNGAGPNSRSLAILQLTLSDSSEGNRLLVAYMLVGVDCYAKSRYVGTVDWSKRFWPTDPLRMWNLYEALHDNTDDHDSLLSLAFIIATSTGIDYTDIANAQEVTKINLRRVKWT